MNDDFNKKLKQITEMLGGNEKASENLAGLLSLLADSSGKAQSTASSADTEAQKVKTESDTDTTESVPKFKAIDEETGRNKFQDNAEMMRTVRVIMDRMQNMNDPRINLLTAIRPFLNNNRQNKLGNCIRLFQMTQLTKLMADTENTM